MKSVNTHLTMRVEPRKVAHDNGNGQCNGQHTSERAQCAYEHSIERFRCHIAVANGCHRDERPPKSQRDAVKLIFRIILEHKRKKDKNRDRTRDNKCSLKRS